MLKGFRSSYIDQNISSITRSRVHALYNDNFDVNFFPLYDATKFQNQSNTKEVVLQLGVTQVEKPKDVAFKDLFVTQVQQPDRFPTSVLGHSATTSISIQCGVYTVIFYLSAGSVKED
jgi:hypothetical protein